MAQIITRIIWILSTCVPRVILDLTGASFKIYSRKTCFTHPVLCFRCHKLLGTWDGILLASSLTADIQQRFEHFSKLSANVLFAYGYHMYIMSCTLKLVALHLAVAI